MNSREVLPVTRAEQTWTMEKAAGGCVTLHLHTRFYYGLGEAGRSVRTSVRLPDEFGAETWRHVHQEQGICVDLCLGDGARVPEVEALLQSREGGKR